MMKYESESRLIKCRQAAAYLGICERKLWELEKNGRVPSVRIDRAVRFDITDLDAFIQQSKNNEK
ncbi:MAG: helix-turn-helix transcriptional regulator [Planctomycetota bacterium]